MTTTGFRLDAPSIGAAIGHDPAGCRGVPVGAGQLADSFRVELEYAGDPGPASVFVKLPTTDPDSAATAARIGAYRREQRFYEDFLPQLEVRTPRLLGVVPTGDDEPALVLEDLSARTRPLDQLRDGTPAQVLSTLAQLPGLQAPLWNDPEVGARPWFYNRLTDHIEGLHDRYARSWARHGAEIAPALTDDQRDMVEWFGPRVVEWAAGIEGPRTLVHQDLRLDNLLWDEQAREAWIVDWQTLSWGPPAWDLAFLMGSALEPADRRTLERPAVEAHVAALAERHVDWPLADAWSAYCRLSGAVLLGMVPAMAFIVPTPRGFDMFRSLLARGAQQAIDLNLPDYL